MSERTRTKAAARCVECETASVVWLSAGEVVPIGTGGECPCGGTTFRILS
ncbi:hypothetical protein [Halalkalicoccus salilacus]